MHQKNNIVGFGFQLSALSLFLLMDVFVKILVADYPLSEVMFYRSVMGLPFLFIYLFLKKELNHLKITRPIMHFWSAFVGAVAVAMLFSAYKYLPLAEASAIMYLAPVFITIMSVIFLKEKIYFHRTFALVLGFLGTMVIIRPDMDFNWYYLYPLGGALGFAILTIIGHNLTKTDPPAGITLTFSLFIAILAGLFTLFNGGFSPISDPTIIIYAIVMGNAGNMAQIFNMHAIHSCHASFYAATKYMGMFGSAFLGLVIFQEEITLHLMIGMTIIAISGIYIAWREHVKNKKDRMRMQIRG